MPTTLPDQWTTEDLPVLRRVAELLEVEHARNANADRIAVDLGIDEADARRSMVKLHDSGYIEAINADRLAGEKDRVAIGLTEKGRRAVGLWPSGDSVDAFTEALQQAIEATDDPKKKGAMRKMLAAIPGVGRAVMTDVIGAVIAKSVTG